MPVADVPTRGMLYRIKPSDSAAKIALEMDPDTAKPHYTWGGVVFAMPNVRLYSRGWLNWRPWFEPTWDADGMVNTGKHTGNRATIYIPRSGEVLRPRGDY